MLNSFLIKFVSFIVLMCIVVLPSALIAGWLDNWFDQHTSSAPNYFEGQKRGYFTAGSFSARIPTSTDYLLNIEMPRIKAGCGGIDMFFGGFGFTNFDYLVQKFQRLIQAAPAVAFQIALNTLSAQLGIETKDIEKIINMLNQIQVNECALLKPFTTIAITDNNAAEKQFVDAAEAALKSTGITDLWNAIFPKGSKVETKSGSSPSFQDQIKGCSPALQGLLNSASTNTGVIGYLVSQANIPDDLASIIRGMVGDIYIKAGESNYYPSLTPACPHNDFQSFKEGKIFKKDTPLGNCVPDNVSSLTDKVGNILMNSLTRMKTKSSGYTSEEQRLMQFSPLPTYKLTKYALVTGDSTVVSVMADPIAKGILYQAYLDIYMRLKQALEVMQAISEKTNNPGNQNDLCNVELVKVKMKELVERMHKGFNAINNVYLQSLNETKSVVEIVSIFQRFEDVVNKSLSEKYGSPLAARALK